MFNPIYSPIMVLILNLIFHYFFNNCPKIAVAAWSCLVPQDGKCSLTSSEDQNYIINYYSRIKNACHVKAEKTYNAR